MAPGGLSFSRFLVCLVGPVFMVLLVVDGQWMVHGWFVHGVVPWSWLVVCLFVQWFVPGLVVCLFALVS